MENTNNCKHSSWKYLSSVGDEEVVSLLHSQCLRILRFCIVFWKGERETNSQTLHGKKDLEWFKSSPEFRSSRVTVEIEWNTDDQRHLMGIKRQRDRMRAKCLTRFSICEKVWRRIMVISRSWTREKVVLYEWRDSPQGEWDRIAEQMMLTTAESTPSLPIHESIVQRSASEQSGGKLSIHYCSDPGRIESVSHSYFCKSAQSLRSSRRNVWRMWLLPRQNRETCCGRTIQPQCSCQVWWRQTYLWLMILQKQDEDLLRRYRERIEKWSQQDRVSKSCTDAGFLTTVEVGQYFMTKDTEEFSQFTDSVACREYTLPRDESSSEPKGWIRVNTKIGPVLEGYNQLLAK